VKKSSLRVVRWGGLDGVLTSEGGDGKKRLVVLLVAAAVFLGSCGTQGVGELQRESQAVDPENAQSVVTELRMGADELKATGGADALMEADFAYNVADWQPEAIDR
jgi:hypothetical protein